MQKSEITLIKEDGKKKKYDLLFKVNKDNSKYVAYKEKNNDNVYFGKLKLSGKMTNVTKDEVEKLKIILEKFNKGEKNE